MNKLLSKGYLPPLIILALIAITMAIFLPGSGGREQSSASKTEASRWGQMSYNKLWRAVNDQDLRRLQLDPYGQAELTFSDDSSTSSSFPPDSLDRLADRGRVAGVEVVIQPLEKANPVGPWIQLLIPIILVGGMILVFFLWRRQKGGSEVQEEGEESKVSETFTSVAGCPEAVEEVREFALFLKERQRFISLGAEMPSGAILHGPPGTGKTLLARALAGEAGVPFYHMAGPEAVNKYVGVGASSVRQLFQKARGAQEGGAVIFIDEIDALGRRRSDDGQAASREHDNTLNQLLVELDGFSGRENIVVIGATNRLDTLDPALLRPGRLSRSIPVLPPNQEGREEILRMYAQDKPLAEDADLSALARITAGSTGADLADMLNEAAIQAGRAGRDKITDADLKEGHLRALAGPERPGHIDNPEELRAIAYHEAGHVICGEMCPEHERVERVTIVARGQAAGMAVWGAQDRALHSPEYVRQRMIAILGGRAAEKLMVGNISSGAANDLQQANELARVAIEDWGISNLTGQLLSRGHNVSDQTRSLVDREVEDMVAIAFGEALQLLKNNRQSLENLAQALLEQKVMERVDILAAIGSGGKQVSAAAIKKPSWIDKLRRLWDKEDKIAL